MVRRRSTVDSVTGLQLMKVFRKLISQVTAYKASLKCPSPQLEPGDHGAELEFRQAGNR